MWLSGVPIRTRIVVNVMSYAGVLREIKRWKMVAKDGLASE